MKTLCSRLIFSTLRLTHKVLTILQGTLCERTYVNTELQLWVQEFTCVIVVMEAKLVSAATDFPPCGADHPRWRANWMKHRSELKSSPCPWAVPYLYLAFLHKKMGTSVLTGNFCFMPHQLRCNLWVFTAKTNFMVGLWTWNCFTFCVSWMVFMLWSGVYFILSINENLLQLSHRSRFCFCIFF